MKHSTITLFFIHTEIFKIFRQLTMFAIILKFLFVMFDKNLMFSNIDWLFDMDFLVISAYIKTQKSKKCSIY